MIKLLITSSFLLWSIAANSQWRQINNFVDPYWGNGESVTYIYFLNLPGPPRIGFAGTYPVLWKTTDGGASWSESFGNAYYEDQHITSICFKDSMTGWFAYQSLPATVFRTTNGGTQWDTLSVPLSDYLIGGIYYCATSNRLFLGRIDTDMLVSTNLGDTWSSYGNLKTNAFSFTSDSIGIVSTYSYQDTIDGILRTTDAGTTWSLTNARFNCWQPLCIPGTPICFAATGGRIQIFRSNDYGENWQLIKDFGPPTDSLFNRIGPNGTGQIGGDLSRLYVETDTGFYVSTDEGVTWNFDGGPQLGEFFCDKNKIFASLLVVGPEDGTLWEEDWPQSGVAEEPSTIDSATASPNPTSTGTIISFGISKEAYVKIEVFDILGNRVSSAGFESLFEPGNKSVPISLQGLPAGTYFARILTAYGEVQTVKLVKE